MKEEYQLIYNKGFLPGPNESEKDFFYRINKVKKIISNPHKFIPKKFINGGILSPLNESSLLLKNTKFSLFHASSTLILEAEKNVSLPIIKSPSKLSSFFISHSEVINHELVHAKRAQFNETKFEETLAYRTSKSFLRKTISPTVLKKHNLILLMLTSLSSPFSYLPMIIFVPLIFSQILYNQLIINSCLNYLKQYTPHYEEILQAMTDKEILSFSFMKKNVSTINFSSFRWQFLETLFGKIRK